MRDLLSPMHFARRVGLTLLLPLAMPWAIAATQPAAPAAQTQIERLNRANAAVVGLRVAVGEDASSADSLGRARSGSGVVIDKSGLKVLSAISLQEAADAVKKVVG